MITALKLWAVHGDGAVVPFPALPQMPTELEFEQLLVTHPDLLEPDLQLVGRQTPTAGGWLDLLAVDGDGRLVVYELKRGRLTRDAVTQVLDYASALDAMTEAELTQHITERSGTAGIEPVGNFTQWYADNCGGDDLSRLMPPRMVVIGLGVDAAAERMARFVSGGPLDLELVTFHGFERDGETLLARQVDVSTADRRPRLRSSSTLAERHRALRTYLAEHGYEELFDRVLADIRAHLPEKRVREDARSNGISCAIGMPDKPQQARQVFGVHAGYRGEGVYDVTILHYAAQWAGHAALEQLQASVELDEWPHGGHCLSFRTAEDWERARPALLAFVDAAVQGRDRLQGGEAHAEPAGPDAS